MKIANKNIRTIFVKELKDILRDRRTLFVAIILPIIINPLLIIGLVLMFSSQQNKQQQQEFNIAFIGEENAPKLTKIIENYLPPKTLLGSTEIPDDSIDITEIPEISDDQKIVRKIKIGGETLSEIKKNALLQLQDVENKDGLDVIVIFPENFEKRLKNRDTQLEPEIFFLGSSDASTTAKQHITKILHKFVQKYEPLSLKVQDVKKGSEAVKEIAKIIPYILILLILTAAFTPAIDLMAGEKERGTIETLLITPADRKEIVLGKFYTVFTIALAATILNLASLGLTVAIIKNMFTTTATIQTQKVMLGQTENNESQLEPDSANATKSDNNISNENVNSEKTPQSRTQTIQPEPKENETPSGKSKFPSMPFILFPLLLLLMIPAAALFGAIAIALSSFAKSYKEGQYYITPVMMVAIPLSMVSLLPGIKFDFWLGITPITNLSLLFRDIMTNVTISGNHGIADINWGNILIVLSSTTIYALLALKWAKDIFYREDVLFREAEEFNWKFWQRPGPPRDIPSIGSAILAFILSFLLFFYIGQTWQTKAIVEGANDFIQALVRSQVLLIALPAIILVKINKYKFKEVFRFERMQPLQAISLFLIMPALSFIIMEIAVIFQKLGFTSNQGGGELLGVMNEMGLITQILVFAVLPGFCEEILFRGYIFSGFINNFRGSARSKAVNAIFWSALLFGVMHIDPVRIPLTFMGGLVLGFVYWRTRNLLASMIAHMVYNSIPFLMSEFIQDQYVMQLSTQHQPWWLILLVVTVFTTGIVLLIVSTKKTNSTINNFVGVTEVGLNNSNDLLNNKESQENG